MQHSSPFRIVAILLACSLSSVTASHAQQNQETSPAQQAPAQPPANANTGPMIILDPAHGGTDSGARGGNGAIEKDIVLQYARAVRTELERGGFRVIVTREDDSNPSYDDRAAVANAYRNMIFVSLHVSSSGAPGTVRAYYYRFASLATEHPIDASAATASQQPPATLAIWERAQAPFTEGSHRLADAMQSEFAQRFSGSPVMSSAVPVRELRSVGGPAVAVEVSSVSVSDPNSLVALAAPLATTIARALTTFRSSISGASN